MNGYYSQLQYTGKAKMNNNVLHLKTRLSYHRRDSFILNIAPEKYLRSRPTSRGLCEMTDPNLWGRVEAAELPRSEGERAGTVNCRPVHSHSGRSTVCYRSGLRTALATSCQPHSFT